MDFGRPTSSTFNPNGGGEAPGLRFYHPSTRPPSQNPARRSATPPGGYKEINLKAMKLLPRGGYLATCSCSHFMTDALFREMLRSAAADAAVSLQADRGPSAGPRSSHPLERAGDRLSQVLPVSRWCKRLSDWRGGGEMRPSGFCTSAGLPGARRGRRHAS